MCDVDRALQRAKLIQEVFLLKDWDEYCRLVRIVTRLK
jgi:hypothetical protein